MAYKNGTQPQGKEEGFWLETLETLFASVIVQIH